MSSCSKPATWASAAPAQRRADHGRHRPRPGKIKSSVGEQGLREIFEISELGAGIIKDRIARYAIDADFCHGYGYMGFNARQENPARLGKTSSRSTARTKSAFLGGSEVKQIIGSDAYSSALLHMGGGHVHSLNLLLGEAKALVGHGVRIFEHSPALEVTMASASPCAPAVAR
jgi:gamma-glutamylputrescine oxidase